MAANIGWKQEEATEIKLGDEWITIEDGSLEIDQDMFACRESRTARQIIGRVAHLHAVKIGHGPPVQVF